MRYHTNIHTIANRGIYLNCFVTCEEDGPHRYEIHFILNFIFCFHQAGVGKLNEAKELVDNLKKKAGEQSKILADKQAEADESLSEITETMKVSQCRQIGNTLLHC